MLSKIIIAKSIINKVSRITVVLAVISSILIISVAVTPVSNIFSKYFFIQPQIKKTDVIIVLSGGSYPNGTPTLFTIERVINGILLYKNNLGKMIIFVGNTNNNIHPDAQIMKDIATNLGISEKDILIETKSGDTYSNLKEVDSIMKNNNFKDALLVTSPVHMLRANLVAQKIGMDIYPATLSFDVYRTEPIDRLILMWTETREIIALLIYTLKGYI